MVEIPPLILKTQVSFNKDYSLDSYAVAVVYCIYDKKKKTIVSHGTSRPQGDNRFKSSIHAEEICLRYCNKYDKRNNYEIYIWRYSKDGYIKPVYCCRVCCKILQKSLYYDKIYTFDNNEICSAVTKPYLTIGYLKKNNV